MLTIVIPMAGRGSRFTKAGYTTPKPLIPIDGEPMIAWVIKNIKPECAHRFIFITQREYMEEYPEVEGTLRELTEDPVIIKLDGITEGAACTVLKAEEYINHEGPLMIANSDQYVDVDINEYLRRMGEADGLIMTFWADDPKWSYCKIDDKGEVREVVEKQVVSNDATVGIYNFRRGREFVEGAKEMIRRGERVNNEFYVAPVYNLMIEKGAKVVTYNVGKERDGMYGLGVPEDLDFFKSQIANLTS